MQQRQGLRGARGAIFLGKGWAIALVTLTLLTQAVNARPCSPVQPRSGAAAVCQPPAPAVTSDQPLRSAFERRQSNLQIAGSGTVIRLLSDDLEGSRHQRFILRLRSGQTVLVAHNIDLAPRVASLRVGDIVAFYGEYEWSEEGGVIHWTHHDPAGRHVAGWLKHKGKTYQ